MAAVLALLVGLVLLLAGLLRAGWIADLLSVTVTTRFLAGISVHIIIGKLPAILGLEPPRVDLQNVKATAARFVDPFSDCPGGRFAASLPRERCASR